MNLERLDHLEVIDPRPLPPWTPPIFAGIKFNLNLEKAAKEALTLRQSPGIVVYADASGHHNQVGAAAVALRSDDEVVESRRVCVGPATYWSVHAAELLRIFYAISLVNKLAHLDEGSRIPITRTATILCDSMSALQAIGSIPKKSGQSIIYAILLAAAEVKAKGISLRLQWMPGHSI